MLKVDFLPLLNDLRRLCVTLILLRQRYILQIVPLSKDGTALSELYEIIKLLPNMRQAVEYFLELVTRFGRIINCEYDVSLLDLALMLRVVRHILYMS